MDPHNSTSEEDPQVVKLQKSRVESPEPSCVSMKSNISMSHPPDLSSEEERPEPSCVSMKSNVSMSHPPDLSTEELPEPSHVYKKRKNSISRTSEFRETGINPRGESDPQDQSGRGIYKRMLTDPISITYGQVETVVDRNALTGDHPCCRNKSKTCLALHPHIEESIKQDSYHPVDDVLQRVLQKHKTSMKNRYESLFEGIKTTENRTLLNRIYTHLYIIEGESEEVNEEHEVLHLEKKSSRYLQDTPINCVDIFKPVEYRKGEPEDKPIRAMNTMDSGLRQSKSTEDKEIRTVLTKGIAGIGKTVSVQKFILNWAEGKTSQDVDFMFVFPFRELNLIKDDQYSLHTLLCAFHPDLKDLDPKIYDTCRVVFIFDGLDESRIPLIFEECEKVSDVTMTSSVGVLITNLLKGELLPSAYIWVTSRPAAANQIPPLFISRVTEIQGFDDPQKEEYFRKRISDQDQAQKIISHIKTVSMLHSMCHIPVFCWISATVLQRILTQSDTEIPKTLTEMYCHFLITQTSMKNEKFDESCDRDTVELLESNRTVLLKLAKLAFNQLMKGNVMFYEEDLRESGIDLTEATLYSGICTEIFREECVLYQRKVFSFVHLSFQEFLAALYVFHCYLIKNMELLMVFIPWESQWPENVSLHVLLREVVNKVSRSQNGHLDLFYRFLIGISQEPNQKILKGLLIHTESSSETIKKTVQHIKEKMGEDLPNDRSNNLCFCLTEMNDKPFFRKIREFEKSGKHSVNKLSATECSTLCCMLQTSEKVKDELDLKKYSNSCEAYVKLLPAVKNCRKALLEECNLTMNHCEILISALKLKNSLIELNLSNNYLQDSGVELLSAGLKSSHCKLETLRLASCSLGIKTCEILGSVLNLENSTLIQLDLSNNDLQDSGGELLSAGLKSSNCKLQVLRLASCNLGVNMCEALGLVLNLKNSPLKEMDLSNNNLQDSGVELLSAGLKSSHCKLQILRLALCNLGVRICEILGSVLTLENSLIELDLSNNDLQNSGVKLLSAGLMNPHCKLETLRLSGCMVTDEGCSSLAAALSLNPSHLKELDLTYNHPGDSGIKLLSPRPEDSQHTLRVEHEGKIRIKPGLKKYGCDLTLDPNTAYTRLSLSEGNRRVVWGEEQPYPDHPERFDVCWQVMSREIVTGRCYWEAEWSGRGAAVALSYKTISRKGGGSDCRFGLNENSWRLSCSDNRYSVYHNNNRTDLTCPPSGCRRVGVYVDCPAGTLSFYRVSPDTHTLTHLHTFTTTFTQSVYAGFYVSDVGSSVRVI